MTVEKENTGIYRELLMLLQYTEDLGKKFADEGES